MKPEHAQFFKELSALFNKYSATLEMNSAEEMQVSFINESCSVNTTNYIVTDISRSGRFGVSLASSIYFNEGAFN